LFLFTGKTKGAPMSRKLALCAALLLAVAAFLAQPVAAAPATATQPALCSAAAPAPAEAPDAAAPFLDDLPPEPTAASCPQCPQELILCDFSSQCDAHCPCGGICISARYTLCGFIVDPNETLCQCETD
jgi:hypothetical protein